MQWSHWMLDIPVLYHSINVFWIVAKLCGCQRQPCVGIDGPRHTGHGWDLSEKKCHRQTISSCHPQHHHYPAHNGLGWQQWSIDCRREGGGVASPVEGGLGVAGLLLDLLQPGALELGPRVAAAQPGPRLGRVIVIQLAHSHSQLLSIVNYAYCLYVTELSNN